MEIGFIGLGIMGRPMAQNLIKGGHRLTVWSRRRESMQPLLDAGAHAASNPAEVAGAAEVVISMVPDAPDVREVMLGAGGIYLEVLKDVVFAPPPITPEDALRMIRSRFGADLGHFR